VTSLNRALDSEVSRAEEGLDQGFVFLFIFLHTWYLESGHFLRNGLIITIIRHVGVDK
jgi:hypothetical protein